MGIVRGPNIVRDGLVLALDAGSERSYPGTGATWNDLSGNGYDATKSGNATYNNNGWFQFRNENGDGDYEYFTVSMDEGVLKQSNTTGQWSLETWWRDMGSAYGGENIIVGRHGHHAGILQSTSGSKVYGQIRTNAGGTGQISTTKTNTINSQWMHIALVYNNRTAKIYVNGLLIGTSTMSSSYTVYNHSNLITIGGYPSNSYRSYADVAVVRAYSKELTMAEVLQNFNSQKNRFNI